MVAGDHPVSKLRSWGRLLRLPNLLTVPGDPLAGALLAGLGCGGLAWGECGAVRAAALAAVSSVLIYAAGLLLNDVCDLREDRRDRPGRPLPAGEVKATSALVVAIALAAAGIAVAALATVTAGIVAGVLVLAVVVYDGGGKRLGLWGPVNMGLCRGLSLLVGAAALAGGGFATPIVLVAAAGVTAYIAAVTGVARGETGRQRFRVAHVLPAIVLAVTSVVALVLLGCGVQADEDPWRRLIGPAGMLAMATAYAATTAWRLRGLCEPATIQRSIGRMIRGLLPLQAGLAAMAPPQGWWVAAALWLLWPVNALLARRFRPS